MAKKIRVQVAINEADEALLSDLSRFAPMGRARRLRYLAERGLSAIGGETATAGQNMDSPPVKKDGVSNGDDLNEKDNTESPGYDTESVKSRAMRIKKGLI